MYRQIFATMLVSPKILESTLVDRIQTPADIRTERIRPMIKPRRTCLPERVVAHSVKSFSKGIGRAIVHSIVVCSREPSLQLQYLKRERDSWYGFPRRHQARRA